MQEAISTARQRRPFTIIGMVLALITLAAFLYVATRPTTGGSPILPPGPNQVVVAKVDIPARATVTSDMLTVAKQTDIPPESFKNVSDVVGKTNHFTLVDIRAGQPVLANELAASGQPTTAAEFLDIPQGFVAVAIPTSEQQGVAGYIQPGDYIGIIAVVDRGDVTVSKTVFNNVHVIRVGTATTTLTPGRNGPTATTSAGAGSATLTVVMNECDAEFLTWFLSRTTLRYTLENYKDYGTGSANNPQQAASCPVDKATGVTNADVVKRYPGLVP